MNPEAQIVIVEDDVNLAKTLQRELDTSGFGVALAFSGGELRQLLKGGMVDLVLLDLNLGNEDGMDIARDLVQNSAAALIIITGRDANEDCISGLEAGADDYITKPFDLEVLKARIRAVLRRRERGLDTLPVIGVGPYRLDTVHRVLSWEGQPNQTELTAKETALLAQLMAHAGRPVHRAELARSQDWTPQDRATDVHVSHIRQKLQASGIEGMMIRPIRGHGYQLTVVVAHEDG